MILIHLLYLIYLAIGYFLQARIPFLKAIGMSSFEMREIEVGATIKI